MQPRPGCRLCLLLLAMQLPGSLFGSSAPAPKAARSVHLRFQAPAAELFYNEVTVRESQNGTYFCVCGFEHGYFGIQQLGSAKEKVAIFSVWDPGRQDDPNSVAEARRVAVLYHDSAVEVRRFGGEGTGAQSFFRCAWKLNETYRFAVRAAVEGDETAYAAYFYLNDRKQWKHLATFRTQTGGDALQGYYSFVEDFRRDGRSPHESRRALFSNGWVQTREGDWVSLKQAIFTADPTPLENINAGVMPNGFLLETGGSVRNKLPLQARLERLPTGLSVPEPLPGARRDKRE
jgi:uncharacterized protein DUF3472